MLRRVGSRPELAIRWKHRPVGQFRHSGTKFNPRQHNRTGKHRHPAGRHNSDCSRFDIAKRDAQYDDPRLHHAEYDATRLYFPERQSEHHDPGLNFAQRDTEHNHPWIGFAANHGSG
jgi:hypothetical protein